MFDVEYDIAASVRDAHLCESTEFENNKLRY